MITQREVLRSSSAATLIFSTPECTQWPWWNTSFGKKKDKLILFFFVHYFSSYQFYTKYSLSQIEDNWNRTVSEYQRQRLDTRESCICLANCH